MVTWESILEKYQAETTSSKRPSLSAIRCTLPTQNHLSGQNIRQCMAMKNWGNWSFNPMELGVPSFQTNPLVFAHFYSKNTMVSCRSLSRSRDRLSTRRWLDDFELPASALSFSKGDCGSRDGVATFGNWTAERVLPRILLVISLNGVGKNDNN